MAELPIGWGERNNTMSEHDMKLGGDAASRFVSPSSGAYNNTIDSTYKSSDEVRAFYMKKIEETDKNSSSLPIGWEERQRTREVEAKQHGAFAKNYSNAGAINEQTNIKSTMDKTAEVGLVQVATHSLNTLAEVLETQKAQIPNEDRASFAAAMKRAMDALANNR